MAHRTQSLVNRFVQNADHATGYSRLDTSCQSSSDLETHLNSTSHPMTTATHLPLNMHVEQVVREYFSVLGDEIPTDLYELILKQVELPLLTVVLEQTRGNQTKCAQILGLNRGTLRKKLKIYNLMS